MIKNTDEKIIDETIKFIRDNDYQQLSLRKISKKAGLTTGAFYKHFKNKDELFYKTSVKLSEQIFEEIDVNQEEAASEQLLQIAKKFCQLFQTKTKIMNFLFFNPSLIKIYQESSKEFPFLKISQNLAYQINNGPLDNEQFFNQIWAFIQGYALLIKNQVTTYDSQLIETTLKQFIGEKI